MITLFHHNISVCAQKVRIALDEKGLQYDGREVDLMKQEHLSPDFLKLNPKGLVPVLLHEGIPISESTIILEYLEDEFPEKPLRPQSSLGKARMRTWTRVPDDGLHIACASVTYAAAFAPQLRENHTVEEWEERLRKLPDATRAARQRQILQQGFNAPIVRDAVSLHDKVLEDMEAALLQGPWLAGNELSLADIALIPYVTRLDRLGLEGMWAQKPHVTRWFAAMTARPSFATAVTAFKSNTYDDELKKRGIDVWPEIRSLLAA